MPISLRNLPDEKFERAVALVKRVATFDPARRIWVVDRRKLERLPKGERRRIAEELADLGVAITPRDLAAIMGAPFRRVEFRGNFAIVRFDDEGLFRRYAERADELFAYEIRRFDPELREYEKVLIRRYWIEDGAIKTYRGLLPRIPEAYRNAEFIEDFAPGDPPDWLRDYQKEAYFAIMAQLWRCGAATLQAATGSGKTEIAIAVWMGLGRPKTFILSLNTDLLMQFKQRFEKYGFDDVGLVTADHFEIDRRVVCCTIQTLYKCLQKANSAEEEVDEEIKVLMEEHRVRDPEELVKAYRKATLVIVDETHHVPAFTVWGTVFEHPDSLRLGLSATPWREDGRDLDIYCLCGEPVPRRIPSSELIEKGYLVPAKILMVRLRHPAWRKLVGESWGRVLKRVIYNVDRMEFIADMAEIVPKPFMILVREIRQGEILMERLRERGLRAHFVSSKVSTRERARIFEMIRRMEIDGIVATTLADEGLDLPPLRTLILAGGGKSSTRALQRVGRVIRPWEGKKFGFVLDIWDQAPYFEEHGKKRMEIYRTEPRWEIVVQDVSIGRRR